MSYIGSSTTTKRSESSASRLSLDGDTTEDGGEERDESKRKSRNLSEKKRRDQFNVLINELCSMVSTTPRKMDKSTVLKATISFLKAHNELSVQSQAQETQETWKPSFLSNEEFTHLMLEALDGFIIVVATSGAILYVSEGITSLLGHLPSDLVPSTIYSLIPSEDKNELFSILSSVTDDNERQHVSLSLNFRLGGLEMDGENPTYQPVKLAGYFKRWISPSDCNSGNGSGGESGIGGGEDGFQESSDSGNGNFVLIATGRLHEAELVREMSVVVDSANNEFSSRHSLEWKFLFLDHRAPPIIGYLPFEVLGTCGYDYYHIDDLEKIATCHEALMQKGEGTSCYYRFLTKGQQWIWLQTRFYITYHQWNSKPEFIVCTHRVVDYADVMKELRGENCIDSPRLSGPTVPKVAKLDCVNKKNNSLSSSNSINFKNHTSKKNGAVNFGSIASKRSLYMRKLDLPPKFATTLNSTHKSGGGQLPQGNQQATQQQQQQPQLHYAQSNHNVISDGQGQGSSPNMPTMCPQPQLNSAVAAVALHPQVQAYVHSQQPTSLIAPGHIPSLNMSILPIPVSAPLQMAMPKTNIEVTALSHNTNFGLPNPNSLHGHGHLAPGQFALQPGAVLPAVGGHSLLTATQFALHDQLLMKHAELQRQIIQQQEELRRVSEQLLISQYTPMQQSDPHAQQVLIPQAVTQQIPQQQHCIQPAIQQQQVMDDPSGHLHGHTNLFHYQTSVMGYTTGGQPPTSGHEGTT